MTHLRIAAAFLLIAAIGGSPACAQELQEDLIRPLAQDVADMLVQTAPVSERWRGYDRNERLPNEWRTSDTEIVYLRPSENGARITFSNIRWLDPDPTTLTFKPIVLNSEPRAEVRLNECNRSPVEQTLSFEKTFAVGKSESSAVEAGFSVTSTSTVEVGSEAAGWSATQEFSSTVSAAWTNETGRTEDTTVGVSQDVVAPPYTCVNAKVTWADQELQYEITARQKLDANVRLGRCCKDRGRFHSGALGWDSLDHLVAVVQRSPAASVQWALRDHYAARGAVHPNYTARIEDYRWRTLTTLTPVFKGAHNIDVDIHCRSLRGAGTWECEAETGSP